MGDGVEETISLNYVNTNPHGCRSTIFPPNGDANSIFLNDTTFSY